MKTIEKEIVRKSTMTVYVANDGTVFESKEECQKYEKSAKGVLFTKYVPLVVKTFCEEDFFVHGIGCCDNTGEIVRVKNQEDADLILQILLLENAYYTNEEHPERKTKAAEIINSAIGDYLLIGRGWDGDSFWLYGSRNSIFEDFEKNFENL